MKLTMKRNYEVEAMFLKMKNGGMWGKIQRNSQWTPEIEGLNWHEQWNYVDSKWGLLDSMKLKDKMKSWTNMKFSPYQNQEGWGVILWHMYWDRWLNLLPDIQHNTQVVFSIRLAYFYEIHPTSTLRPNECYSHWRMMLGMEVSCEIHSQLQQ
jgi:hypothetical protein